MTAKTPAPAASPKPAAAAPAASIGPAIGNAAIVAALLFREAPAGARPIGR